jgi:hypothetical protein
VNAWVSAMFDRQHRRCVYSKGRVCVSEANEADADADANATAPVSGESDQGPLGDAAKQTT